MKSSAVNLQKLIALACWALGTWGQSTGEDRPVSATISMLKGDPQGRGTLLKMLGDANNYQPAYQWSFDAAHYNVDPTKDPGPGVPATATPAQVGVFHVVGDSGAYPVHAIPFANDLLLFIQRGNNANGTSFDPLLTRPGVEYSEMAALYNMVQNTFVPYHIKEHAFCAGHTLLPDGHSALIVGGENLNLFPPFLTNGIQSIRIFDSNTQEVAEVATMDRGRWYPSVMTMPDGTILVIGGSQQEASGWGSSAAPSDSQTPIVTCMANAGGSVADPTYDNPSYAIFFPNNNTLSPSLTLTLLLESWPINLYPWVNVLPTGSTLVIAGSLMQATYFTPDGASLDMAVGTLPSLPIPVSYPQYATMTLLPLEPPGYSALALIAGGTGEYCANQFSEAAATSFLVDCSVGADHTLITESTAFPRVMGDLTLLPDGTVLLCNGAKQGIAGGAGPNRSAANIGSTICELYNATMPVGQRWSTLGDSGIWRMYHSWAFLTKNATVLIGGSDQNAERRVQEWIPPYLLNGKPRPTLSGVPASLTWNQPFSFLYQGVSNIDRVVLNRYTGATHGVHFDQRQVMLACSPSTGSGIECTAPPNSSIAPPGLYMLFASSSGVPSLAPFVLLEAPGGNTEASLQPGPSITDPYGSSQLLAFGPQAAMAPEGPTLAPAQSEATTNTQSTAG